MFEFEVNDQIIMERQKAIEAALSTGPKAEKVLRQIIRKYILEARQQVVNSITFTHGDPREARNLFARFLLCLNVVYARCKETYRSNMITVL